VGQGYASRAVTQDLAAGYPLADPGLMTLGLLHTSLDGRPGHDNYAPTTVEILRSKGYQYWALGHVHQREIIATDPWIVFPGNTQGRHMRETGPKGAVLLSVEADRVVELEEIRSTWSGFRSARSMRVTCPVRTTCSPTSPRASQSSLSRPGRGWRWRGSG